MSYDLYLKASPGATLPSDAAVREWLAAQPGWGVYDWGAAFRGEHTGAEFRLHRNEEEQHLSLTMSGNAAHVVGPELCRQVRALVDRFGLEVNDPQMEGMGEGPLDEARLLSGWSFYNGFSTKTFHGMLGQPVPPHLAAAKLEAAVAWNANRVERDDLFSPTILFHAAEDGTAETYVAWVGGEGLLPVVDVVVTPRAVVRWSAIAEALAGTTVAPLPAPHCFVDGAVAEALDAVFAAAAGEGEMPRAVAIRDVRTTEVVAPYLGPSSDPEVLGSAAVLAHQTGDRKKAFASARRLVEVDPTSHTGAIIGAINGLYLAEYAEAARLVEIALGLHAEDRTARIVRCALRTETGLLDEAIADADAALASERDAMVLNMKAFALAAAGQPPAAQAAYEEALALVDAELAQSPDDADLVSRRAYSLIGLGRAEEAATTAERAISLGGDPFLSLQTLGRARLALGDFDRAIEALTEARQKREQAPQASYYLALALTGAGRSEEARAAVKDASVSPYFRGLLSR
jgi:tetratricopeptide (TPR) repeat protein